MKVLEQKHTGVEPCAYRRLIINDFEAAIWEGLAISLRNEVQNVCDEKCHSIFECGESGLGHGGKGHIGRCVPHNIFILMKTVDLIAIRHSCIYRRRHRWNKNYIYMDKWWFSSFQIAIEVCTKGF
ncbi:hypothetical protein I7I53_03784 [Histoplasma capsulatum var. duboisii H88]|uniref:Uncharacterized protein n=1 Tax=Ajellomyces capsulatus (strain H88) TaxID=544711 RepID=A0A8A1LUN0_AJEC8|nr:hypothetical protein I7I53_03784 [Histoplasma capsulatum var. duboisii H88]